MNSTFGGKAGLGNSCANGGAISSIGVSWNIINSLFSENTAVGNGANEIVRSNPKGTFETPGLPGFYVIAKEPAQVINSEIL